MSMDELRTLHIKEGLAFLDQQRILQPSVNDQVGFDFQGLRYSFRDDPRHPDAKFVARFGRIWIYDVALGIYADLKAGRLRQAGYQVGRAMQLAFQEEAKGFRGGWHFSYNTREDSFIDPRGPAGANAWCINAVYSYILAAQDTSPLAWLNRLVQKYLFSQQVLDPADPRYGLFRAGLHNAQELALGPDQMGYKVYEGEPNRQYEHVILEHNADIAGTLRLAFRATKRFAPRETEFLAQLIRRHDLLMQGIKRGFWVGDHFVSAMDGKGKFYLGTDGAPSIAIDNNTWAAHVFIPYEPAMALSSLEFVRDRFSIRVPPAHIEDVPAGAAPGPLEGVFYFTAAFQDPFVEVPPQHRTKLERLFQLEAAYGLVLFMRDAAESAPDQAQAQRIRQEAAELYSHTVTLQRLYGPSAAPYASANVPAVFSTLNSVTTAATGIVVSAIMGGASGDDFIGVIPPLEFAVAGKPPAISVP
ncbi:MAG: hypothetical protein NC819_02420 [Candidatus Omnitrophica bacterium]|nr:hypothetical protein [Candidatus Omnitrophota bacterium]